VAWTGSDAEFQTFIDRHGLTFTQLGDDVGAIYDRFAIPVQPAVVVVRPDGHVETLFGAVDAAELDRLVNDALA
jgi:peroxiredoxin